MSYSTNYKSSAPYCHWYMTICDLKSHIEERCKEITEKHHKQLENYHINLEEAYKNGEEYGMIYEQHNDLSLDIRLKQNNELISLENEIKSVLEKVLKEIISHFELSKKRKIDKSYLSSYIQEIEEKKKINMVEFSKEKKDIFLLNTNRNNSEHKSDNLLREIDQTYIQQQLNSVYSYMNALIQKLYNNKE